MVSGTGCDTSAPLRGLSERTDAVVDYDDPWASSVRKFVGKKEGVDRTLDEVLKLTRQPDAGTKR